ncbi:MAG: energy-coupling factor transporter ATPase [Oscillospiraceae bacterium]|jgi:energy-coupling factor transport system ATP-binding protein|nr:energy-coupling factor transporter ATPase [Oscillospiraceae bacterium]
MPLISLDHVSYTYPAPPGGQALSPAVEGVSLCVDEGEFVAILGANGSGKSTLAKLTNGILLPDSGAVTVADFSTADEAHINHIRQAVGLVFQNPDNQIVATIVEEDAAFGPENLGIEPAEIRARVEWALRTVGLWELREREPHRLSGGQKQRLAIAGILAMRPRCIVLDEPTAMLDPQGRREVLDTLEKLRTQFGMAVVLITHYMHEAVAAQRVIVMEHGHVTLEGTPREVFAQPEAVRRAGLRLPQSAALSLQLREKVPDFPLCLTATECAQALHSARKKHAEAFCTQPQNPEESPAAPMDAVLETQGLTHRYTQNSKDFVDALRALDLQVHRGECLGIIGHTGSGKSTLIQHFNALLAPTEGVVLLDGHDINENKKTRRAARFAAGLCFQYPESQLFAETVREDIAFGPQNLGLSAEEVRTRVETAAARVGLDAALLGKSPFELSGGEKRRAALAGVMAMEPKVLILDEPAAGLDPKGKQDLRQTLRGFRAETGCTIVLVSHSMDEIAALCARVLVLSHGEKVLLADVDSVFTQREKLHALGLELPEIAEICALLRQTDWVIPQGIYTPEGFVGRMCPNAGGV